MPFSVHAALHVFTKTDDGGIQRVVARDPADTHQAARIREHLRSIQTHFQAGDYSAARQIHGAEMPGMAQLAAARPGQVSIVYEDVEGGAQLRYRTQDPALITALHAWFDAQVVDHGSDAMAGHEHTLEPGAMPPPSGN